MDCNIFNTKLGTGNSIEKGHLHQKKEVSLPNSEGITTFTKNIKSMNNIGKAFRTVRLIKDMTLLQAADKLGVDERSLRDMENGKTTLVTERFSQLLEMYQISASLVFDIATDQSSIQNTVQEVRQNATGMVFNYAEKDMFAYLEKRVAYLEEQNRILLDMLFKQRGELPH